MFPGRLTSSTPTPYALDELKTALEADSCLPSPSWRKTKRRYAAGLGRNCLIFDSARLWAYREVRNHFGSPESLERAVTAHVHGLNADFKDPLPEQEAQQIANSIVRWVVAESRLWNDGEAVYEATFTAIQFARGRKGGIKSGNVGATKARERNWLL
ncbi:primase C-terminal domain-containing protein [Rothia sp. P5764]|uniref:primase C-terminal domain-containing protein n=1 Tax=Rothia sp. P5764 TaxID=3402654 RepID=UPI003AD26C65